MQQHIMSIDVEEWYHAEFLRKTQVNHHELTTYDSINEIVQLLNSFNTKATFFVVGELLERVPKIGSLILENGHELAFHGWNHKPLWYTKKKEFRDSLDKFQSILNQWDYRCKGFRAPSASLDKTTAWALDILREEGYQYDSSIFPARTTLYGVPSAPVFPYRPSHIRIDREGSDETGLIELPFLALGPAYSRIPLGTGFFFRVFPKWLYLVALMKRTKDMIPAVLSFHSWEYSGKVPKIDTSIFNTLYIYTRLGNCKKQAEYLLKRFSFTSIERYLERAKFL